MPTVELYALEPCTDLYWSSQIFDVVMNTSCCGEFRVWHTAVVSRITRIQFHEQATVFVGVLGG